MLPAGALGVAQYSNSIMTLYGCTRNGTQVLCDSDLSNQDSKNTQVQSASIGNDAYIIDDRGDRHTRTGGFFVNVDGDQRTNMDIPYGQSARYILVFNDVPAKVQQVSLISTTGALNVENIAVADPNANPGATATASSSAPGSAVQPSGSGKPGSGGGQRAAQPKPAPAASAATAAVPNL